MSYDIRVVKRCKNGEIEDILLKNKHDIHGGTYCLGGTTEAWFNITYNYSKWFYELWPATGENDRTAGIRYLYGKPLDEVIKLLGDALTKLKGEPDDDYWAATEGNARESLVKLKSICELALDENIGDRESLTLAGD